MISNWGSQHILTVQNPVQVMVVAILLLLWSTNVPTLTEAGGALEYGCISDQSTFVHTECCPIEECEKMYLLLCSNENIDDGGNCPFEICVVRLI